MIAACYALSVAVAFLVSKATARVAAPLAWHLVVAATWPLVLVVGVWLASRPTPARVEAPEACDEQLAA